MPNSQAKTPAQKAIGDFAPKLGLRRRAGYRHDRVVLA
jgi:hypothetical protein